MDGDFMYWFGLGYWGRVGKDASCCKSQEDADPYQVRRRLPQQMVM